MSGLNKKDIEYMLKYFSLPVMLKMKLSNWDKFSRCVTKDEFDLLYDLTGERLQVHGFDEDYKPTEEGLFLENLIDKLYKM